MPEKKSISQRIFAALCAAFGVSISLTGCPMYGPAPEPEMYGPPDVTVSVAQMYGIVTEKSAGTKLSGINVKVLLGETEIASTVTDSNGNYYFSLEKFQKNTEYTIVFEDKSGKYKSVSQKVSLDSLSVGKKIEVALEKSE